MLLERPRAYDRVLAGNEHAYASYTHIGGVWMGGLFARRDLQPGQTIARYVGREYYPASAADDVDDQSYMFTARMVQDGRKRVVIDGNPQLYRNLAGFANYAEGKAANAHFVDEAKAARDDLRTNVLLRAARHIPSGTEIRVDYDMGSSAHPFRDQMLAKGIPRAALQDATYRTIRWLPPDVVHASATLLPKRVAELPLVHDATVVTPFATDRTAVLRHGAPSSSSADASSPRRAPSAERTSPSKKRPRGRPPKGKVWDPARGYI